MRVSIVIPVLNEERTVASALEALTRLAPDEIVVVDGGSTDQTQDIVGHTPATLLTAPRGRASQMNYGARMAQGEILLFLHADTRLPATALADIRAALENPKCVGGCFDVRLDRDEWIFRWIGALINIRSRLTKTATGGRVPLSCA